MPYVSSIVSGTTSPCLVKSITVLFDRCPDRFSSFINVELGTCMVHQRSVVYVRSILDVVFIAVVSFLNEISNSKYSYDVQDF